MQKTVEGIKILKVFIFCIYIYTSLLVLSKTHTVMLLLKVDLVPIGNAPAPYNFPSRV